MIIPVTDFAYGSGPGVIIESHPKLDRNAYDDAGLVRQALRNIEIDSMAAQQHAEGEHGNYDGEMYDKDRSDIFLAPDMVEAAYNELDAMGYRTNAACWWFPSPRQLENPVAELSSEEQPEANDIFELVRQLKEDAHRFQRVAQVLLRVCEASEEAYDKYRGTQDDL